MKEEFVFEDWGNINGTQNVTGRTILSKYGTIFKHKN